MRPARELKALRQSQRTLAIGVVESGNCLLDERGTLLEFELSLDLAGSTAERFGLALRCSEDQQERTLVYFDAMARRQAYSEQGWTKFDHSADPYGPAEIEQERDRYRVRTL